MIEVNITEDEAIKVEVGETTVVMTDDYEPLKNKPRINGVELIGNKSSEDLDLLGEMSEFSNAEILKIWNEH